MNWYKTIKLAFPVKKIWTKDELQNIQKLFDEGKSFKQVAEILGVGYQYLYKQNKNYKWKDLKSDEFKKYKEIVDLYLIPPDGEGLSYGELRRRNIVSGDSSIQIALKYFGLEDKWRGRDNEYVSNQVSNNTKEYWKRVGGLEGYLNSIPKDKAEQFLNKFLSKMKNNRDKAFAMRVKYMEIIMNNSQPYSAELPEMQPQQPEIQEPYIQEPVQSNLTNIN